MFGFLLSLGFVIGDTQIIGGDVPEVINFTLITENLNYGSVIPGAVSDEKETTIRVNENNNIGFSIDVTLTDADTSGIFENIYLEDVSTPGEYTDQLLLTIPVARSVVDSSSGTFFDFIIKSVLKVPIDSDPIVGATGTVTYTITA